MSTNSPKIVKTTDGTGHVPLESSVVRNEGDEPEQAENAEVPETHQPGMTDNRNQEETLRALESEEEETDDDEEENENVQDENESEDDEDEETKAEGNVTVGSSAPDQQTDTSKTDPDTKFEQTLPVLEPTEKLRIASWNCGGGLSNFVNAVFIILMNIFKMDIIFVQELKSLQFVNLFGHENYRLIKLPPLKNSHSKRGLFLMYRKEIESSMYNTRKKRTGNCSHTNNKVTIPKGNIEFCSIDVLMEGGLTMRLINLYHAPGVPDNCASELDAVVGPLARNIETVLMGDANMETKKKGKKTEEFSDKMGKYAMNNRLLEGSKTYFDVAKGWTQPDILYSSVKSKLLVHKPHDPHELILNIMKVFDTRILKDKPDEHTMATIRQLCEKVLKDSQSSRPGTDTMTDLTNLLDVISLEDLRHNEAVEKIRVLCRDHKNPANIKPGKYHCILIVELGVNGSDVYQCSLPPAFQCTGDCTFFRQSIKSFLNSELNPS